jgi:hypothetical protein
MKKTKVYEGELRTVRGLESVTFVVFDEKNNPIMETTVKLENLGALLFGASVKCLYIPTGVDRIGKKTETKQEEIFVPFGPWEQREVDVDTALASFEVDGWFANRRDLQDPRRFVKHENNAELLGAFYDVRFERFIEDPTKQ